MSEHALRSIASGSGTFSVLKDRVQSLAPAERGNSGDRAGKALPEAEAEPRPNLAQLASQLNMATQSIGRDLRFQVDLESGRSVIQVLDRETGEIIRQIPEDKVAVSLNGSRMQEFSLYDELV